MDTLKTGDLILFNGHNTGLLNYFSSLIRFGTHSDYTHVGVIIKDPTFINPVLKGLYVWESGYEGTPDPQDNKIKVGVQITPLFEMIQNFKGSTILFRKINCNFKCFTDENLKKVHEVVYNKPYDFVPKDWLEALIRKDSEPQKTDRFWCSALVGYIYTKCGILDEDTDWSILRPSDFSLAGEKLTFINGNRLENFEVRLN